jgi:hemin uptake protein HemP
MIEGTRGSGTGRREEPREVDSLVLFAGRREIVIRHADTEYHLRITRAGKLILTK